MIPNPAYIPPMITTPSNHPAQFLEFTVTRPGAAGDNTKVEIVTGSAGSIPRAQWRNNNLIVTLPSDGANISIAELNEIIEAAGLNPQNTLGNWTDPVTGVQTPLNDMARVVVTAFSVPAGMNPEVDTNRTAIAGINATGIGNSPHLVSPGGGQDSFFQAAFSNLGNIMMRGGAYFATQDPSSVEIEVDRDGTIIGNHPVHKMILLGRIDIVEFINPEGLQQVGTSYFVETMASGPAQVKIPQTEADTEVVASALEMSNVDLSQEFSDMIITQRGFQANSRIITVSDSMLEELVNLKR
jgi:flagellar hook protein FlgE